MKKPGLINKIVLAGALIFAMQSAWCQTTGDYRSSGTGNWSTLGTWQRWSGAAWAVPTAGQGYPGQNSSPALVTILSNYTVTLDVSPANSISALSISPVTFSLATLQFNAGTLLTVSGTVTLGNAGSSSRRGALTMTNGGTLICNRIFLANSGANTFTPGTGTIQLNATNTLPATIFTTFNNLVVNSGTTTLGVGISLTGTLTISSGATLSTGSYDLTLGGNFVNNGTFAGGSSNIIISGTAATQNIGAFTVTGNVTMSKTAGIATLTGNFNSTGLIINGSGGTLDLGTGLIHTITGNWTRTNGTLNGGSSFFRIGGSVSGTGGTFNAGSGIVEWNASGAQTIANLTYNNLSLDGSGTKTFPAALTINGYLSVSTGAVANLGTYTSSANTLSLGGIGQVSGSWGSTASSATNKNNTYFSPTNGIVNVSSGSCATYMGYGYDRHITIDFNKVAGGSDLYNFPLLVNLTGQNFLMNVPTGQVFNSNGYDIVFTDENNNRFDHQLEYFDGTNGDLIAWVRIPILSHSSNTIIKIMYGNPLATTDPSVTTVWDSHYKGVWHLDNNSLSDFTSYNKAGTPFGSPTYPAGRIYNSLGLNGTNQYVEVNSAPNINFAGNITVSAWVYMNAGGRDQKIASNQNNSSGGYKFGIYTNDKVEFEIRNSSNTPSLNRDVTGGTVLSTGQWYYLSGISSDVLDSIKTFVNGIPERPFKKTGILGTASNNLVISKEPFQSSYYFSGRFDELRISDVVRSNGWLRTEYNNQSSPSTFYTVDATGTAINIIPSAGLCSMPMTLTFGYPAGGTYSGNSYITGDNVFNPPAAGTYSITYTYDAGCGTTSVTLDIIITDQPAAPAASNKVYCSNQIAYLEATTGVNIRWYSGGTLVSTANPFSTGQTTPGTYNYTVTQTVNGCESTETAVSLTIYGGITINTQPQPTSICTTGNGTFSVSASGVNLTYQWQEAGVNISDGGIYSGATTPTLTLTNPGIAKNGLSYRCVISTSCGTSPLNSNPAILTVTSLPVATFSYTGTPYCPNASNPSPTFSGGGIAGTFSSTSGLVFVSTATGQVNIAASTPGSYTVTNTIAAAGGCGIVTATSPISIIADIVWNGSISTDWNVPGNWSCGIIPLSTLNVEIPNVTNKPVLSSGAMATVRNLVIDNGSSLTISGNKIQISGTMTNSGTFTASDGTIELNGTSQQTIGAGIFAGNIIKDLIINNSAGVILQGPLSLTGIAKIQNGDLSSGGNLTLASSSSGTALIDGSGTGTVSGSVTMQRYLASGYGYKYFSSPFQAATVNEFLDNGISLLYRYDENRLVGGNPASGWVNYKIAANVLNPVEGYAVNFGSGGAPNTVDVTGVVTNGIKSITLYNHDQIYTKGFNLIGNPYPSPIDWKSTSGWTKTNIDDALYYFNATDQYGGTYSTYINGVSSDGLATRIIPSMQGFFVHVAASGPPWPVTGTLSMDNGVRITDQTHGFLKSAKTGPVPLIRLTACFSDDTASIDPVVLYVDENATEGFDSQADALKLLNTDMNVPNLYAVSINDANLSIDGLPIIDSSTVVPLGLKINRNGSVIFKIRNIESDFSNVKIVLSDIGTGIEKDLQTGNEYQVNLVSGEYKNRFYLNFRNSVVTGASENASADGSFTIFSSHGILKTKIRLLQETTGTLQIFTLTGQLLFNQKIYESGYYEFSTGIKDGIYIATFSSGRFTVSKKLSVQNQ